MPRGDRKNFKADCEDGFTRIANLLLEALALAKLNGTQKGICMFIFRRTYGWNRTEDAISLGDFAEACGSSRSYISRQLSELIKKNIIFRVSYEPGKTPVYSFRTKLTEWDPECLDLNSLSENSLKGLYDCTLQGLCDSATQGLQKTTTTGLYDHNRVNQDKNSTASHLETSLKTERKKVKERKIYSCSSEPFRLSELLLTKILEHLPGYKKPDLQKWAWQMDALMRLDQRNPSEVEAVIIFAQSDPFWRTNILSVDKLRKQYDQLNSKRMQSRAGPSARIKQKELIDGEEADEYKGFFQ